MASTISLYLQKGEMHKEKIRILYQFVEYSLLSGDEIPDK